MNKTTNPMTQDQNNYPIDVFEITGNDAVTFLNNQVLSELNRLSDTTVFTAICNPKGRILFSCILKIQENQVLAAVDASLGDNFLQYINMRRFRMDFEIKKSKYSMLFDAAVNVPNVNEHIIFTDQPDNTLNTKDFWLFMMRSGLPWVTAETSEKFIPQYVNLDQNNIIAFDKGCYPGQEIVARLHFLGKVKKRMQTIQYEGPEQLPLEAIRKIPNLTQVESLCSPAFQEGAKWTCQAIIKL